MKKKYLITILAILIILLVGLYLFLFQKEVLKQGKDKLINFTTFCKVTTSDKYKNFSKSDKSKKYYKSEKNIKISILLYHQICDNTPERQNYHLSTTTAQFKKQITDLKNLGYTFITYDDLIAYNNNELALPEFCAIISFDDGYKNVYENAYPVIKDLNIPITIFVIDNCVGTNDYFSWDDAREMDKSGIVNIYSHGKSHINYSEVNNTVLLNDITYAHTHIENELGHSVSKVMAYPYGDYNDEQVKTLYGNGFVQNILSDIPNCSATLDMSKLTRIFIRQNDSVYKILDIIL